MHWQPGSIPTMHSTFNANQTARYITHRAPDGILIYFLRMICMYSYESINLNFFFYAPRTCCCWWLCQEVGKRQKTVRTRRFVRFINTVNRRETVEKRWFRSCPEKKRENREKPRFCTPSSYRGSWRENCVVRFSLRWVEAHRRKKRSTGNRA